MSSSIWLKASLTTELTPAGKPEHYAPISIQNGKGKNNLSIKMCWQQETTERQDLFPTHRVTARLKCSSKKMEASTAWLAGKSWYFKEAVYNPGISPPPPVWIDFSLIYWVVLAPWNNIIKFKKKTQAKIKQERGWYPNPRTPFLT